MFFEINEDICVCHDCGHRFYHVWTSSDADVPAVERFPIACPECGSIAAHRADYVDLEE